MFENQKAAFQHLFCTIKVASWNRKKKHLLKDFEFYPKPIVGRKKPLQVLEGAQREIKGGSPRLPP